MKSSINCVEIKNLTRSQCTFAKCCLMRTGQILNTSFILRLAYWTVERNTIIITMSEWFSKTHWYFQVLYVIYTMNQNHIFFFYFCDTRNWGNTKVSIFLIMEGLYWLTIIQNSNMKGPFTSSESLFSEGKELKKDANI